MKSFALLLLFPALALAQPAPPMPPAPPPPPGGPGMGDGPLPGIPPDVAQRLGIPPETVKKVRDMSFDANEQLITLEADVKRAHLDFQRLLSQTSPEENTAMQKLEAISKTELAVKKNRIALMLRIRKLLGPELWQRLESEMPSQPRHGSEMYEQMKEKMKRDAAEAGMNSFRNGSTHAP